MRRDGLSCGACSSTAPAYRAIARLLRARARGNAFRVGVVGTTNTQAVLAYSAPDAAACTVKVSQQASLTPLVHDVDPILFPGADQDTRPETVSAETAGSSWWASVSTQRASDGKNYSRALEAYANHYYQVTCGAAVATGSFTTANIPLGMTYNDVPQVDGSNPGQWMIPTQLQDRTQTIVDPQTGALLKRVSWMRADNRSYGYVGLFLLRRVSVRVPPGADRAEGTPSAGICAFSWTGPGLLYFIVPATGEARSGRIPYPGHRRRKRLNVYYSDPAEHLSEHLHRRLSRGDDKDLTPCRRPFCTARPTSAS